jgi:hypothetical protein
MTKLGACHSVMYQQDSLENYGGGHNPVFRGTIHVRLGEAQTNLDVVENIKICNPCRNSKPDSLVLQITPKFRMTGSAVSTLQVMTLTDFHQLKCKCEVALYKYTYPTYVETKQRNALKLSTSLFFFNNGSYMFRQNNAILRERHFPH